jgi:hypothetical protein
LEVDGGGTDCGEKCRGELTGVEAVLVEEDKPVFSWHECGKQMGKIFGCEFGVCRSGVGRNRLQGGVGLNGDVDAGESVDAAEEVGIERLAEGGQRQELGWVVGIVDSQHARGRRGGFGEWLALVKHGDAVAAVVEFKGEGEADDAGSGDAEVGMMHGISLVRLVRGYSFGVSVLLG